MADTGNLIDLSKSAASPTDERAPSIRREFQSHGRTLSMADDSGHQPRTNRFSIQFPIQPAAAFPAAQHSPLRASVDLSPVREPSSTTRDPSEALGETSDGNYLHLIAAQERKVLELKEQLQDAEVELDKLKRLWARHEVNKKRDDLKRLTKMQPLQTPVPASPKEDDSNGSSAWLQQEMEKRKALMAGGKTSNMTVFAGQRHTRALSLLTPSRENTTAPVVRRQLPPPRKDSLKKHVTHGSETLPPPERHRPMQRASTTSDLVSQVGQMVDPQINLTNSEAEHDVLLRAGKKMATDFKDGLWTFWEDLRQATVGEESLPIQPPRKKSSTQTLKTAKKQTSKTSLKGSSRSSSTIGKGQGDAKQAPPVGNQSSSGLPDLANPSFWSDHGAAMQSVAPVSKNVTSTPTLAKIADHSKSSSAVSEDVWTWDDSPVQSRSGSSVTSEATTLPSTVAGSPRTSNSINRDSKDLSKKEAIPWPALKKSGIGSLRRTASHLLTEWEKQLTPTPGEEYTGDDYLGAGAEALALGARKVEKTQ